MWPLRHVNAMSLPRGTILYDRGGGLTSRLGEIPGNSGSKQSPLYLDPLLWHD